jgi:mevalonate pyrophosphate decarboxylase
MGKLTALWVVRIELDIEHIEKIIKKADFNRFTSMTGKNQLMEIT